MELLAMIAWGIVAAITVAGLVASNKKANEHDATTPPHNR